MKRNIVCVLLAGGKGKRMRSNTLHKVCFPVAGVPAIVRTMGVFKSSGIKQFCLVVGMMVEQVISTVAEKYPKTSFVYQSKPRGTGHAASCATDMLKTSDFDGDILICMGDKMVQPSAVSQLLAHHGKTNADVTLTTLPMEKDATPGRVCRNTKGKILGIVEKPDIDNAITKRQKITIAGESMTPRQVENRSRLNASLYIFKAPALYKAIGLLSDDNAQGELYLTDTIEHIVKAGGKVAEFQLDTPEDLMAYNTPEELLKIEEVFAKKGSTRRRISAHKPKLLGKFYKTTDAWLKLVQQNSPRLQREMKKIYGPDESILKQRRQAYIKVLKLFAETHGKDRKIVLIRAPGRINLLGRHVDHRGGYVNTMAINREVVLAASPRQDDVVTLRNVHPKEFPAREFSIGELLGASDWMDWMDYINSTTVEQVREAYRGDWSNYAKAAVLRLQHACPDHRLSGMDCVVTGDIPMGAGLSSSSAVVVGLAEAALTLNGLDVKQQEFVDMCGEGEWFVGSRGGSADHAAIRSGIRGRVVRVGFFPFRIEQTMPFPKDQSLVIVNSHIRASKSAGARDTFNHRVSTFNIAELYLREHCGILKSIEHLRDINPVSLGVDQVEIYRALKRIPVQITRRGVLRAFPQHRERLETIFATHKQMGAYRLRDVAMYGISECLRSDMYAELLESNQLEQIGRLMQISHDGDRIVSYRDGWAEKFAPSYSDAKLDKLIKNCSSNKPELISASQLWAQCGRYACSTPEIDYIVDLACAQQGVIGAQLAGAGLGGCAMILANNDHVEALLTALRNNYYKPRNLKPDLYVCKPVTGSGLISV